MALFLGIDLGSSALKLSVVDGSSGSAIAKVQYPETEMTISAPAVGWAEQDPEMWWSSVVEGCKLLSQQVDLHQVEAIGIAYQMHGLVVIDQQGEVLRPAIIWCDSRAVGIGQRASADLDDSIIHDHLLNSPGNFTASKLSWVKEHQPEIYERIDKMLLPGDFIAYRLTGRAQTTPGGLSEGVLWDFRSNTVSHELLRYFDFGDYLIPEIVPAIGVQSRVSEEAAGLLGIKARTPICYRAGDQPNNAFALNVLHPGEVAATAGTSAVIYAVTDQLAGDEQQRINTFRHMTSHADTMRNGILLCINGSGIAYGWLKKLMGIDDYALLNDMADNVPIGAEGLLFYPYGNGAERLFHNQTLGAHWLELDFNRHEKGHMVQALQEGIAFSLCYGLQVIQALGGETKTIRAGNANLFLSNRFRQAFVNTAQVTLELFDTDGAEGAARGAALGHGFYTSTSEAFRGLKMLERMTPDPSSSADYQVAYRKWVDHLENTIIKKNL